MRSGWRRWLFGHQPAALTSKAPEQHVALGRGVPVYVTYLTAQPGDGKMTFADDIYGLDRLAGSHRRQCARTFSARGQHRPARAPTRPPNQFTVWEAGGARAGAVLSDAQTSLSAASLA